MNKTKSKESYPDDWYSEHCVGCKFNWCCGHPECECLIGIKISYERSRKDA